jgi:hypothetical protein
MNRVKSIPVLGDSHQHRRVSASGDTFLSIVADTGLASVGHGAVSRRDRYRADTACGRGSHATGSMHLVVKVSRNAVPVPPKMLITAFRCVPAYFNHCHRALAVIWGSQTTNSSWVPSFLL